MQSNLTHSLPSFLLTRHCLSRWLGAQGLQTGLKSRYMYFLFGLPPKTHESYNAKNKMKIQLSPNLQQAINRVKYGKISEQSYFFTFAFLSVNLKDQRSEYFCHIHFCVSCYYRVMKERGGIL